MQKSRRDKSCFCDDQEVGATVDGDPLTYTAQVEAGTMVCIQHWSLRGQGSNWR